MFEVTKACGAFMKLLEEQLDRVAGMKDAPMRMTGHGLTVAIYSRRS